MRKVSIKNLYKDLSKHLYNLPFEITNRGKHMAYVVEGLDNIPKGLDKPIKPKRGLDVGTNQTQGYMGVVRSYSKAQQVGKK